MTDPSKKQRWQMAAALRKLARAVEKRGLTMTMHTDHPEFAGNAIEYRLYVEVKAPRKRKVAL